MVEFNIKLSSNKFAADDQAVRELNPMLPDELDASFGLYLANGIWLNFPPATGSAHCMMVIICIIFATNTGALPTERRTENKVMLIQNMRTIFLKKKGMFRTII